MFTESTVSHLIRVNKEEKIMFFFFFFSRKRFVEYFASHTTLDEGDDRVTKYFIIIHTYYYDPDGPGINGHDRECVTKSAPPSPYRYVRRR